MVVSFNYMLTAVVEDASTSFTLVKLYLAQRKKKMFPVITLDYSDCALILKQDFTVAVRLGGAHLDYFVQDCD